MRGLARIYDVRMAQFVLKIEKLSHIMGPRASQDLRSPSPIMAPDVIHVLIQTATTVEILKSYRGFYMFLPIKDYTLQLCRLEVSTRSQVLKLVSK